MLLHYLQCRGGSMKSKSGEDDLKDKHHKGRPITEVTQANIEKKVRFVIENDKCCTYDEIEAETKALSRGTI